MTRKPRLLLISPAFHGYHESIRRAFEGIGYEAISHCYDAFGTLQEKLVNKVILELPPKAGVNTAGLATRWTTERTMRILDGVRPDRLVVIKGDTLGSKFWSKVADLRVPRILWLYDDLSRHDYTPDFLRGVGPVVSYSRQETDLLKDDGVNASFLPNGFDPGLAAAPDTRRNEIVFVGSRYPNRTAMLKGLVDAGVPVRAYGRQWSHHWFDKLRTWEISRPDIPAERDIPLREAYLVQAEAAAAINIHGLQSGLAMRTFEVPGMGGLQLVDRPDVSEFYDVGTETLVFTSPEELLEQSRRAVSDTAWADGIRAAGRRRSLAHHTFGHRVRVLEQLWD